MVVNRWTLVKGLRVLLETVIPPIFGKERLHVIMYSLAPPFRGAFFVLSDTKSDSCLLYISNI